MYLPCEVANLIAQIAVFASQMREMGGVEFEASATLASAACESERICRATMMPISKPVGANPEERRNSQVAHRSGPVAGNPEGPGPQ